MLCTYGAKDGEDKAPRSEDVEKRRSGERERPFSRLCLKSKKGRLVCVCVCVCLYKHNCGLTVGSVLGVVEGNTGMPFYSWSRREEFNLHC